MILKLQAALAQAEVHQVVAEAHQAHVAAQAHLYRHQVVHLLAALLQAHNQVVAPKVLAHQVVQKAPAAHLAQEVVALHRKVAVVVLNQVVAHQEAHRVAPEVLVALAALDQAPVVAHQHQAAHRPEVVAHDRVAARQEAHQAVVVHNLLQAAVAQ